MSGKLDQSLDEILSTQRKNATGRRRSTRRTATTTRPAAAPAPAGGIQKNKATRTTAKGAPARAAGASGESKIVVSNLPKDVSEGQIKEYFQSTVGQVKRVELSYGPNGVSRGVANVIFPHSDGASKAFKATNGILIDNRPVRVEVVVSSAELIPEPKTLSQRMSQPKSQPKSAATVKHGPAAKAAAAKPGAKKGARKPRNARPAKKTAEELDSEMADYFDASNENANGGAPAAANTDAPMEDEVL
ncbi:hypothetical protein GQ53DRAFT_816728 [Thozetella sp. PMI_491]|nr:hypothetical protein GQ53DRAFT_816728 [Thozetella sp. PMI_491]